MERLFPSPFSTPTHATPLSHPYSSSSLSHPFPLRPHMMGGGAAATATPPPSGNKVMKSVIIHFNFNRQGKNFL